MGLSFIAVWNVKPEHCLKFFVESKIRRADYIQISLGFPNAEDAKVKLRHDWPLTIIETN
jgi:hypothetical protein